MGVTKSRRAGASALTFHRGGAGCRVKERNRELIFMRDDTLDIEDYLGKCLSLPVQAIQDVVLTDLFCDDGGSHAPMIKPWRIRIVQRLPNLFAPHARQELKKIARLQQI